MLGGILKRITNPVDRINRQQGVMELDPYMHFVQIVELRLLTTLTL